MRTWGVSVAILFVFGGCAGSCGSASTEGEPRDAGASPVDAGQRQDAGEPDAGAVSFGALDVKLHVEEFAGVDRALEPVRSGVPIPRRAAITDPAQLAVTDSAGRLVPYQLRVTSRWEGAPDDSTKPIKWVLLDVQTSVAANGVAELHLRTLAAPRAVSGSLVREDTADHIVIDTGAASFTISKVAFNLFDAVTLPDATALLSADPTAGIFLRTPDSTRYLAAPGATLVTVEEDGPLHAVVVARGKHRCATGALLDFTVREHFDRGRADVLVAYTFTERDLPQISDYVSINQLGVRLPVSVGTSPTYTFGGDGAPASGALTGDAFQRQTGGLDAAMGARFNPDNADTISYSNGGLASGSGGKAPGWADVSGAAGGVTAAVRWYWQQYPKKLFARADALTVELWPAEEVDLRVYAAAQKTHEMLFSFHPPAVAPQASGRAAAARLAEPLFARADPSWYAKSWVWNKLGIADASA